MHFLPSIASADQLRLGEEIRRLGDWPLLHLDIEDGNFTPNITFGLKTARAVAGAAEGKYLDAHLMVTNPLDYLEPLASLGIRQICAHLEALPYPLIFLNRARELHMKVGLALNLSTPLSFLDPFLDVMDYALLMTSEADGRGEQLYEPAVGRVLALAEKHGRRIQILADGGLDIPTLKRLAHAGVSGVVLGRLVFGAADPRERLSELNALLNIA